MINRRAGISKQAGCRVPITSCDLRLWLSRFSLSRSNTRLGLCRPGLRYGPLPVRCEWFDQRSWFDRLISRCMTYRDRHQYTQVNSSKWLEQMAQRKKMLGELAPAHLDAHRAKLVQSMRRTFPADDILDDALAHAIVAVEKTLQLVPRSNQCLAARAMLCGHSVEMATGEGKTLSVALAAAAAALSGTPVHVLTANDYLAARDALFLDSVYASLGLRVASAVSNQEPTIRRQAYCANVVYVTAKQVAFDWLNDALQLGTKPESLTARLSALTQTKSRNTHQPMLRGLCLAIVDEADSLLVDEARIPLVLAAEHSSHRVEDTEATIALGLAEQLRAGVDYTRVSYKFCVESA